MNLLVQGIARPKETLLDLKLPFDESNVQASYAWQCLVTLNSAQEFVVIKATRQAIQIVIAWGILPQLSTETAARFTGRFKLPLGQPSNLGFKMLDGLFSLALLDNDVSRIIHRLYLADLYLAAIDFHNGVYSHQSKELISNFLQISNTEKSIQVLMSCLGESARIPNIRTFVTFYLSDLMFKRDGIVSLFNCVVRNDNHSTQPLEHVSTVLCSSPQHRPDYLPHLCAKLAEIMTVDDYSPMHKLASAYTALKLLDTNPDIAKSLLLAKLFDPFIVYYNQSVHPDFANVLDINGNQVLCNEKRINDCISAVQLLMTYPNLKFVDYLCHGFFNPLYQFYAKASETKSHLLPILKEILLSIFNLQNKGTANALLFSLIENSVASYAALICPGEAGGLLLCKSADNLNVIDPHILCALMKEFKDEQIISSLFVNLVERGTIGTDEEDCEQDDEIKALYMGLTLAMMETFEQKLLTNDLETFQFLLSQLMSSENETVSLGLSLLNQMLQSNVEDNLMQTEKGKEVFGKIKVVLNVLCDSETQFIGELARKTRLSLMTQGSPNLNGTESDKIFNDALDSLRDELVPIRAHGINQLKMLVLQKDPIAFTNLDTIISIFLDLLNDEDSFLYLNAVKGVSSMATVYPTQIIHRITKAYSSSQNTQDYIERLGEAFLQVIRSAGNSLEIHGKLIFDTLMLVLNDKNMASRQSALSLLASITETNFYLLLPFINQILAYIEGCLKLQEEDFVKQGALLVASAILRNELHADRSYIDSRALNSLGTAAAYLAETSAIEIIRINAKSVASDCQKCSWLII